MLATIDGKRVFGQDLQYISQHILGPAYTSSTRIYNSVYCVSTATLSARSKEVLDDTVHHDLSFTSSDCIAKKSRACKFLDLPLAQRWSKEKGSLTSEPPVSIHRTHLDIRNFTFETRCIFQGLCLRCLNCKQSCSIVSREMCFLTIVKTMRLAHFDRVPHKALPS